jgi:hypothetical protein
MLRTRSTLLVLVLLALAGAGAVVANPGLGHPNPILIENDSVGGMELPGLLRATDRLHAALVHENVIYALEDHYLYVSTDSGASYERRGKLPKVDADPFESAKDFVARLPPVRGIRRYRGPPAVSVLESGTILVYYDRIYRSEDGGWTFDAVPGTEGFRSRGMPSSRGRAVGPGDTVYFGEYITHDRPHEVHIIRGVDDGRQWNVAYTFPSGQVFHVHGVHYDQHRDRYWVMTGDIEDEAALWYTDDGFRSLHQAGCCSQAWRIVDLVTTREALYWASDDDRDDPGIFRYFVESDSLQRVADLRHPSYNAALLEDGRIVITTTYEPGSRLDRGPDPPPRGSEIWISQDGTQWQKLAYFPGETEEMQEGERPRVQLPSGDPLPFFLATPRHTESLDFQLLQFR